MKYVQNVVRPKGCNFKQNRNPFHLTRRQLFARISYPPISRKQVIQFARRAAEFLLRKFCEMEKGSQRQEKWLKTCDSMKKLVGGLIKMLLLYAFKRFNTDDKLTSRW